MKKVLTLTLLLVFLCALTLTFTACSFFATADPIVGKYCGQINSDTSDYQRPVYAYWEVTEQNNEILVDFYMWVDMVNISDEHWLDIAKISDNGEIEFTSEEHSLTLTKTDTGYTASVNCSISYVYPHIIKSSKSTYTVTLNNDNLTIEYQDDTCTQTYTLTSTTKTFLEYDKELYNAIVKG